MNLRLDDKIALVTASTAGIGYAIALDLAREGARVVVNGRTDARRRSRPSPAFVPKCRVANLEGISADLGTASGVPQYRRPRPQGGRVGEQPRDFSRPNLLKPSPTKTGCACSKSMFFPVCG